MQTANNTTWDMEYGYSNDYVTTLIYIVDGVTVAKQTIYYSDVFGNSSTIELI